MGGPRQNEQRFYRYPMNRIVAVMDDKPRLDAALADLDRAGVDLASVNVLSGEQGAALLDVTGARHGVRGRLLRLVQRGASEADLLQAHLKALQAGGNVVYVPVKGPDERQQVLRALRKAGGHHLTHFRRWATEHIP
jgi:hypothetical protein